MTQSAETFRREPPSEDTLQLVGSLAMDSVEIKQAQVSCLEEKIDLLKTEMELDPTYTKVQLRYFVANPSVLFDAATPNPGFSHDHLHKEFLAKYKLDGIFGFSDRIVKDAPAVKLHPVPDNDNFYIVQELQFYPHDGIESYLSVKFEPGTVYGYRYTLEYIDPINSN